MLPSQGEEAGYCHFHRKTFKWLVAGERGVTRVTTRSKSCTTKIYGASLLGLLLEKQVLHHANDFIVLKNSCSALCRNSEVVNQ